jgi:hypothetical protein
MIFTMALVQQKKTRDLARNILFGAAACICATLLLSSLSLLSLPSENESATKLPPFPVSVDPETKTIREAAEDSLLSGKNLAASVFSLPYDIMTSLGVIISSTPWYRSVAGPTTKYVKIYPGYRKEEVAAAFGAQLGWSEKEEEKFLDSTETLPPTIAEGYFKPGVYVISPKHGNADIRTMITERFNDEVASRYSTSAKKVISLDMALTIASIIEREAGSVSEMRTISGIIWNRLFDGMNLQMDATLQYAKGGPERWWPPVRPADKYIESPYNTYQNEGLPPTPIANPSIAAVEAALNPRKTSCMFYFHDRVGGFHCSKTYAEHASLIKKYYKTAK